MPTKLPLAILASILAALAGCAGGTGVDRDDGDETDDDDDGGGTFGSPSGAGPSSGAGAEASGAQGSGASSSTGAGGAGSGPTTGAGGGTGGGGVDPCAGEPIQGAPLEQWAWLDVPEAVCGNGTSTGLGLNFTNQSADLVIFLMGGGGCYDAQSCASGPPNGAAHLDGYGPSELAQELGLLQPGSMFDRASPANPFKDMSWIIVPYCTGDFHSGDTVAPYGIHHRGFANMKAYLERIVPTFCTASRVVLAGASAGGFGATFNYHQVKAAFGSVPVDLVDDSGPPLSPNEMPLQNTMRAAWASAKNAPPGCAECQTSWAAYFPHIATTYPDARLSLISSLADFSIGPYFGGPIAQPPGFQSALDAFADSVVGPLPNARVFYVDEFHHVYLAESLAKTSMGVSLGSFLAAQIDDSPNWQSVRP